MQFRTRQPSVETSFGSVQGVLDGQPTSLPGSPLILTGWRVGPAGSPIQGRIRETKSLLDQFSLRFRGGHPGYGVHLIQRQLPSREPFPKQRKILQPSSHPHQLGGCRMTQPEPGRNPLHQVRGTIRQKLLTTIRQHQPLTSGSKSGRHQTQEMADPRIDLIVRNPLQLHTPNIRSPRDKYQGVVSRNQKEFRELKMPPSPPPAVLPPTLAALTGGRDAPRPSCRSRSGR